MTVLNPLLLWGLLFLLAPLIIHFLRRPQAQKYDWAASSFLEQSEQATSRPKSLRERLLLLCRLLLILLLVLGLCHPIIPWLPGMGQKRDHLFVLLDRSPVVQVVGRDGRSQLERNLDYVERELAARYGNAQVYVMDSENETVFPLESVTALKEIAQSQPSALPCRLPVMLSKTLSAIQARGLEKAEIWLVSGRDQASWDPAHSFWTGMGEQGIDASGEPVTIRPISAEAPRREVPDVAITLREIIFSASRESLRVHLELRSPREMNGPLALRWQPLGSPSEEVLTELYPAGKEFTQWIDIPFTEQSSSPSGGGRLSLPADPNLSNNEGYYAYGPPQKMRTILVTTEPDSPASQAYWRASALRSQPEQEALFVRPEEFLSLDLSQTALLIWLSEPGPNEPEGANWRERLEAYVASGGVAVICPSPQEGQDRATDWYFSPPTFSAQGAYYTADQRPMTEGPWRESATGSLPLDVLQAVARVDHLDLGEAGEVLAAWSDGAPLLSRRRLGEGTIYFITTLPDPQWSNLEQSALHLILVQRLLESRQQQGGAGYLYQWTHELLDRGPQQLPFHASLSGPEVSLGGLYQLGDKQVAINASYPEQPRLLTQEELLELLPAAATNQTLSALFVGAKQSGILFFLAWGLVLMIIEEFVLSTRLKSLARSSVETSLT